MKKKFDFTAEMEEAQVTCIFRRIPVQHFR